MEENKLTGNMSKTSRDALQSVLERNGCCILRIKNVPELPVLDIGENFTPLTGYTMYQFNEEKGCCLLRLADRTDGVQLYENIQQQLETTGSFRIEYPITTRDGRKILIQQLGGLSTNNPESLLWTMLQDISDKQRLQEQLMFLQKEINVFGEHTQDIILTWERSSNYLHISSNFSRIFGFTPDGSQPAERYKHWSFLYPEDKRNVGTLIESMQHGHDESATELRIQKSSGEYLWCQLHVQVLKRETVKLEQVIGVLSNIDLSKRAKLTKEGMEDRDPLTGLYNRSVAFGKIDLLLRQRTAKDNSKAALLFLELDDFEKRAQELGTLAVDALLREVAAQIQEQFRAEDIAARIGGNMFMIFMENIKSAGLIAKKAELLVKVIRNTFVQSNGEFGVTCSVGSSCYPDDGRTIQELCQKANTALQYAKKSGNNCNVTYASTMLDDEQFVLNTNPLETHPSNNYSFERHLFELMYGAVDLGRVLPLVMSMAARYYGIHHVYCFLNGKKGVRWRKMCEHTSKRAIPFMKNIALFSTVKERIEYYACFDEEGVLCCMDLNSLPERICRIFQSIDVHAVLQCALKYNNEICGCIGFSKTEPGSVWSSEEVDGCRLIARTVSLFLRGAMSETAEKSL